MLSRAREDEARYGNFRDPWRPMEVDSGKMEDYSSKGPLERHAVTLRMTLEKDLVKTPAKEDVPALGRLVYLPSGYYHTSWNGRPRQSGEALMALNFVHTLTKTAFHMGMLPRVALGVKPPLLRCAGVPK